MNEKLIKLQHFFEIDIRMKKEMNGAAPPPDSFDLDERKIVKYTNDLNDSLKYMFAELKCVALDLFGNDSILLRRIFELEKEIYNEFYSCHFDMKKIRGFYENRVTTMELDFQNLVKKECVGYLVEQKYDALDKATSINCMLHYIHSFVLNNEGILQAIPPISKKINNYNYPIIIRGKNVLIFNQLFENFPLDLDVGYTDMVAINDNKLLMMIRDRGHALTIEITLKGDIARIEYFIPKLCNVDMINVLPGVRKVKKDSIGATGATEVPTQDLSNALFDFISKVPTDFDMVFEGAKVI